MTATVSPTARSMGLPVLSDNPLNAIAAALTGRDYLSHTQITTFQSCPLRWYFDYVAGLPHEQVAAGLVFGGSIHSAIEHHHRAMLEGASPQTVDALLAAFNASWNEQAVVPVHYAQKENADSLRELAARMIGAFLASELSSPEGAVLAIEDQFRGAVDSNIPDLLAKVDLVVLTDHAMVIRDYKTSKSRWTASKVAESAGQLLLYAALARMALTENSDIAVRLEFVVVTKSKDPTVESHVVEPNDAALDRTRHVIQQVWQAMQAGHIYPNPSPMNCASCPFRQACRNWEG